MADVTSPNRSFREWVKARETPLAQLIYKAGYAVRTASVPVIPGLHLAMYYAHRNVVHVLSRAYHILYITPLFKARLDAPAPRLFIYGGMPLILGPLKLTFGSDCRVAGKTLMSGRSVSATPPKLIVGDNCSISWGVNIAVADLVKIGNNVRIAADCRLTGYPGHPLNAKRRAAGEADDDNQTGPIILEDDVWLGARCIVSAGVTIGRGTVVANGSVVTKDLPPNVLAAGIPAVVKRQIENEPS